MGQNSLLLLHLSVSQEHGSSNTDPILPADEFDSATTAASAAAQTPAANSESSTPPSTDDNPPANSNESVKRSPPNTAAAPPSTDPPKTSRTVSSSATSPPSAGGKEGKNAEQLTGSSEKKKTVTAESMPKQKQSAVPPAPDQGSRDASLEASNPTSAAPLQESAPRELPASSGGGIGLDDLMEEDLVSAIDTEDLTEQMRVAEQLRLEVMGRMVQLVGGHQGCYI